MAARRALTSSAHWSPVPVTNGPDEAHGSDRSDALGFVVVGRRRVSSAGPAAIWESSTAKRVEHAARCGETV